jgi:glycosyltransferase involved in cell wall biosynthesis
MTSNGAADGAPLVDVGIPVFRRADWVAEAIESVIGQSYGNWRLTISEDRGPTQPIVRAVEPYLGDARIRYLPSEDSLGIPRNKSIASVGEGKYVTVLDDDDIWMDGWLARRVELLERNPACGMVCGGHFDITPDRQQTKSSPLLFAEGVHSSADFVRVLMQGNFIATSSVLVRRDAYVRAGDRYDTAFIHINDYELWLRLGVLRPVGFLAVHDSGYRIHDIQRQSRMHEHAPDHLRLIDHLDALLAQNLPELRLPAATRRRRKADAVMSTALDAVGRDQTMLAVRRIAAAARLDPRTLATRRAAAAVAATVGGRRVRERISAMRS